MNMHIDNNIKTMTIADKAIVHFKDFDMTGKYAVLADAGFTEEIISQNDLERKTHQAIVALETLGYIEQTGNSGGWFFLTDNGRMAKKAGGHFAYIKKLEEKAIADTERQKLNDEKLEYDVKNAKRIFKTYWWTFAFAVVGLVISLVLGLLKLLEVFQQPPVK